MYQLNFVNLLSDVRSTVLGRLSSTGTTANPNNVRTSKVTNDTTNEHIFMSFESFFLVIVFCMIESYYEASQHNYRLVHKIVPTVLVRIHKTLVHYRILSVCVVS